MSDPRYLSTALKIEQTDKQKRATSDESKKAARKRQKNDDEDSSHSNLNRAQSSRNKNSKRKRGSKETSNGGRARLCYLCKAANLPSRVYESHDTKDCKNNERFSKQLSGGAGSRKRTVSERQKLEEKAQKHELKMYQMVKEFEKLKKKRRKRGSTSDSEDTDSDEE